MKKYFYTNGVDKFGPYSLEEFKGLNLSRETLVWFYGLKGWTALSEIKELKDIASFYSQKLNDLELNETEKFQTETEIQSIKKETNKNKRLKKSIIVFSILLFLITVGLFLNKKHQDNKLYLVIKASAYASDIDFNFYVKKFYRDVEVYGVFPKKPKTTIIKLAKLDQLDNATHIHGISYGMNDDERIEIYINPSTWESFNKPMRYFLMYHELAHDVLNIDDLPDLPSNEGKLMYPAIATYESKTMDDFIESSHSLFEDISNKKTND